MVAVIHPCLILLDNGASELLMLPSVRGNWANMTQLAYTQH